MENCIYTDGLRLIERIYHDRTKSLPYSELLLSLEACEYFWDFLRYFSLDIYLFLE